MEGSDFDYYAQNRPKPEDFPKYEPQQPIVIPKKEPEKKPVSAGAILAVVIAGMLVLMVVGGALLLIIL